MKINLTISPTAQRTFESRIREKIGAKVESLLYRLQDRFISATPMNTGRTLASWAITRGAKSTYDAVSDFPNLAHYEQNITSATNHLPIGSEPGRSLFVAWAQRNRDALKIRQNPYDVFYVSNAAKLDSLHRSDLMQGPGSRAYYLDLGTIPGYDLYSHPQGQNIFDPRGIGFYRITAMAFKHDAKARA